MKESTQPNKSILILAYFFPPKNAAGAARPFRFYKYLPRCGYVPTVICEGAESPAPLSTVIRASEDRGITARCLRILEHLLGWNGHHLAWLPDAVREARHVIATENTFAVLSTFPPLATHLAALALKRRYGIQWFADFRDPLSVAAGPNWSDRRMRQLTEWIIIRCADVVIANTEVAAAILRRRYPNYASKVQVLCNGFDPEDALEPLAVPAGGERVLVHAGDIYSFRHPGRLLLALERVKSRRPDVLGEVTVRLFGEVDRPWNGIADTDAARLLASPWLQCCSERIPHDQARRLTAQAAYLLLVDSAGAEAGVHVPVKLFDYIRIGRPILALTKRGSSVQWILDRSGIPSMYLFEDDSDAAIDEKLMAFFQWPIEPASPSQWFMTTFDGAKQVCDLAALLGKGDRGANAAGAR